MESKGDAPENFQTNMNRRKIRALIILDSIHGHDWLLKIVSRIKQFTDCVYHSFRRHLSVLHEQIVMIPAAIEKPNCVLLFVSGALTEF